MCICTCIYVYVICVYMYIGICIISIYLSIYLSIMIIIISCWRAQGWTLSALTSLAGRKIFSWARLGIASRAGSRQPKEESDVVPGLPARPWTEVHRQGWQDQLLHHLQGWRGHCGPLLLEPLHAKGCRVRIAQRPTYMKYAQSKFLMLSNVCRECETRAGSAWDPCSKHSNKQIAANAFDSPRAKFPYNQTSNFHLRHWLFLAKMPMQKLLLKLS